MSSEEDPRQEPLVSGIVEMFAGKVDESVVRIVFSQVEMNVLTEDDAIQTLMDMCENAEASNSQGLHLESELGADTPDSGAVGEHGHSLSAAGGNIPTAFGIDDSVPESLLEAELSGWETEQVRHPKRPMSGQNWPDHHHADKRLCPRDTTSAGADDVPADNVVLGDHQHVYHPQSSGHLDRYEEVQVLHDSARGSENAHMHRSHAPQFPSQQPAHAASLVFSSASAQGQSQAEDVAYHEHTTHTGSFQSSPLPFDSKQCQQLDRYEEAPVLYGSARGSENASTHRSHASQFPSQQPAHAASLVFSSASAQGQSQAEDVACHEHTTRTGSFQSSPMSFDSKQCQQWPAAPEQLARGRPLCPATPATDSQKKLMVILRGLPGSGKSTLAKSLRGARGIILSTDNFFVTGGRYQFDASQLGKAHEWNQKLAQSSIEDERSPIIIDNTNTQAWEMKPYVEMATAAGYRVEIQEPQTTWKWSARELSRRNAHGVPQEKIRRMLSRYQRDVTVESIQLSAAPGQQQQQPAKKPRAEQPILRANVSPDRSLLAAAAASRISAMSSSAAAASAMPTPTSQRPNQPSVASGRPDSSSQESRVGAADQDVTVSKVVAVATSSSTGLPTPIKLSGPIGLHVPPSSSSASLCDGDQHLAQSSVSCALPLEDEVALADYRRASTSATQASGSHGYTARQTLPDANSAQELRFSDTLAAVSQVTGSQTSSPVPLADTAGLGVVTYERSIAGPRRAPDMQLRFDQSRPAAAVHQHSAAGVSEPAGQQEVAGAVAPAVLPLRLSSQLDSASTYQPPPPVFSTQATSTHSSPALAFVGSRPLQFSSPTSVPNQAVQPSGQSSVPLRLSQRASIHHGVQVETGSSSLHTSFGQLPHQTTQSHDRFLSLSGNASTGSSADLPVSLSQTSQRSEVPAGHGSAGLAQRTQNQQPSAAQQGAASGPAHPMVHIAANFSRKRLESGGVPSSRLPESSVSTGPSSLPSGSQNVSSGTSSSGLRSRGPVANVLLAQHPSLHNSSLLLPMPTLLSSLTPETDGSDATEDMYGSGSSLTESLEDAATPLANARPLTSLSCSSLEVHASNTPRETAISAVSGPAHTTLSVSVDAAFPSGDVEAENDIAVVGPDSLPQVCDEGASKFFYNSMAEVESASAFVPEEQLEEELEAAAAEILPASAAAADDDVEEDSAECDMQRFAQTANETTSVMFLAEAFPDISVPNLLLALREDDGNAARTVLRLLQGSDDDQDLAAGEADAADGSCDHDPSSPVSLSSCDFVLPDTDSMKRSAHVNAVSIQSDSDEDHDCEIVSRTSLDTVGVLDVTPSSRSHRDDETLGQRSRAPQASRQSGFPSVIDLDTVAGDDVIAFSAADEEVITANIGVEFAQLLQRHFGAVDCDLIPENLSFELGKKTARSIYRCWQASAKARKAREEDRRRRQVHDDAEFAKAISMHERLHGNIPAGQPVSKDPLPHEASAMPKRKPASRRVQASYLRQPEKPSASPVEDLLADPGNDPKRQLLYRRYPSLSDDVLDAVFVSQDGELHACHTYINATLAQSRPPGARNQQRQPQPEQQQQQAPTDVPIVDPPPAMPWPPEQLRFPSVSTPFQRATLSSSHARAHADATDTSRQPIRMLVPSSSDPAIRTASPPTSGSHRSDILTRPGREEELQSFEKPDYRDYRAEAQLYRDQYQECLRKSREAHGRSDYRVASHYSNQGRQYYTKFQEADERAAQLIFDSKNPVGNVMNQIDLHGLHVKEAVDRLDEILSVQEQAQTGLRHIFVVTGRGLHSNSRRPKLKPAVDGYLRSKKYDFEYVNPGLIKVHLKCSR